jgi:predicted PurR-regulated permease PerM
MTSWARVVEYAFFFVILLLSGYLVWQVIAPFFSALALSLIIVTLCYPLYERILRLTPWHSRNIAALFSTLIVVFSIILPLVLVSLVLAREMVSFYHALGAGQEFFVERSVDYVEEAVRKYIPDFELNFTDQIRRVAEWFAHNLGHIVGGTVAAVFFFLISFIGSFFFFRDGKELLRVFVKISPLPDKKSYIILERIAQSIRSVIAGVVLVSLIQGILAAIGFTLFGIPRGILWGSLAAVAALIPGVGTAVIAVPAIAYLFFIGETVNAFGLLLWSLTVVALVDNLLGPYLMSRGNNLHPFIILISVLGGLSFFGPIGFVVGPVILTLFMVLLEVHHQYIKEEFRFEEKQSSRSP